VAALVLATAPGPAGGAITTTTAATRSARTPAVAWVATGASVTLPGTSVTPVRLPTRRIEAGVPVGSLPSALAFTPGGAALLVVTQGDDMLHEIDPTTHAVVRSVGVGVEPDAVAVAPGGTRGRGIALVANLDSDTVTPVDLGTWRAGAPIPVGSQPVAIAVWTSASGAATAFVADFGADTVTPIDVSTLQPGAAIPAGPGPQAIAVAAGEVLVGDFSNRSLTPVNASTLAPGPAVALPLNPTGIAVGPSGATAYVCGGAGVVAVSTLGLVVGPETALPDVAQGIALAPDGTTAWVTQQAGSLVSVVPTTGRVGRPIRLGGHPSAIVIGAG
jgi:YVTN family beta-propeller protein